MANTYLLPQYKWKLGAHIPILETLHSTVLAASDLGFGAMQFFLGSPYSMNRRKLDDNDIASTRRLIDMFNLKVFSHSPYIHNLSGSVKCLCWESSPDQDSKTLSSIKSLEEELLIMSRLKGGVVIHPGSFPDRDKCLKSIIKTINKISFPKDSLLLLENSAGEGTKMPKTVKDIAFILEGITSTYKSNVGVCIDTAHIHGQGDYNLSTREGVDSLFGDISTHFGIDKVKLIHLNDSGVKLGAKRDKHAVVGEGMIWGKDTSGLKRIIEYCIQYDIPTVTETESMDITILEEINDVL